MILESTPDLGIDVNRLIIVGGVGLTTHSSWKANLSVLINGTFQINLELVKDEINISLMEIQAVGNS